MPRRPEAPQRLLATVLFTDIVASTQRAAELGDRRWRQLLSKHHAVMRRELKRFGGREVDTAGDGFFATFEQPAQAIRCAEAVIRGVRRLGIEIRAGVHMGEVETHGENVSGITVHIGARVMAQAGPGEVLVSSTVRELLSGSEMRFDDRGTHELKGVPVQWRLYALESASEPVVEEEEPEPAEPGRRHISLRVALVGGAVVVVGAIVAIVALSGGGRRGGLAAPRPNTVVRIDPAGDAVVGGIPVGTTPIPIAADAQGVWVANADDATLQHVAASTNTASPARALPAANTPRGLAVGGGFVWVTATYATDLYKIDPNQAHFNTPIAIGLGATGVAFGDGAAWVTNQDDDTVLRIDPQGNGVSTIHLPPGSAPVGIAFGDGAVWVGESLKGSVVRIDPSTMKPGPIVPLLSGNPDQLAFGEGYVWVTDPADNSAFRIDPATNQGTTIDRVGTTPSGVAAGAGGVWVANSGSGTVARIDPRTARVVHTYELGFSPDGVAIADGAVWVTLHAR